MENANNTNWYSAWSRGLVVISTITKSRPVGSLTGQYYVYNIFSIRRSKVMLNDGWFQRSEGKLDENGKNSRLIKYFETDDAKSLYDKFKRRFASNLSKDINHGIFDTIMFGRLLERDLQWRLDIRIDEWSDTHYRAIVYSDTNRQACICCANMMTRVIGFTDGDTMTGYDLGSITAGSIATPKKLKHEANIKRCVWINTNVVPCGVLDYGFLDKKCQEYGTFYHFKQQYNHLHYHKYLNFDVILTSTDEKMPAMDVAICDTMLNYICNILRASSVHSKDGKSISTDADGNFELHWEKTEYLHEIPNPINKVYSDLKQVGKGVLLILMGLLSDAILPRPLIMGSMVGAILGNAKIDRVAVWKLLHMTALEIVNNIADYPFYGNIVYYICSGRIPISDLMMDEAKRYSPVPTTFPEKFVVFNSLRSTSDGWFVPKCINLLLMCDGELLVLDREKLFKSGGITVYLDEILDVKKYYIIDSFCFHVTKATYDYVLGSYIGKDLKGRMYGLRLVS